MRRPARPDRKPSPVRWPHALAVIFALLGLVAPAARAPAQDGAPTGDQVLAQMKAALEPDKSSVRRMQMTVIQDKERRSFTLAQARKRLADGARSLIVLLEPDAAKGLAYLMAEKGPGREDNTEWIYIPVVRRVRELTPAETFTGFLESDFTYADLGLLDLSTTNKLLGTESIGGKKAFKVESIPDERVRQWYFARIVTWVDADTLLPVKREFVSPSGLTFKVETFESVSRVDGIPTPFKITMQNLPAGTSTELQVTDLSYGLEIPDDFFGKDKLRTIADLTFWGEKR